MKPLRCVLTITLAALCAAAQAQTAAPPSDAQKSFEALKTLAGKWSGPITVDDPTWQAKVGDKPAHITMHVASRGNALVHDYQEEVPETTVFYIEGDQVMSVHYCEFGNRPRLAAHPSPDGKVLKFHVADLSGPNQQLYVSQLKITIVDPNHHIEVWTVQLPDNKLLNARFDLKRDQ